MINYYFNNQFDKENKFRPYTHKLEANDDTLPPDNALRVAPEFKDGYKPCEQNGKWVLVEDHRDSTVYDINTKESSVVNYLGEIKEGFTLQEPFKFCKWDTENKMWVKDKDAENAATIKQNIKVRDTYVADATTKIETLTNVIADAIELDMPVSDIELQLKNWKKYRILLSQLDVSKLEIEFPEQP